MTNVLTEISAAEMVKRLLDGERDFASTRIASDKGDFSKTEGFEALNRYLPTQDLRENPIIITGADWKGVKAAGLFLNAVKAAGINLEGADLRNADVSGTTFVGCRLMEADFTDAIMRGVDLYEANLSKGKLVNCDLTRAYTLRLNLGEVDMTNATMTDANLYRSDLRGAIGLETVRDLGTCQFKHTAVTSRERDVILAAMEALPRFDLRTE